MASTELARAPELTIAASASTRPKYASTRHGSGSATDTPGPASTGARLARWARAAQDVRRMGLPYDSASSRLMAASRSARMSLVTGIPPVGTGAAAHHPARIADAAVRRGVVAQLRG